MQDDGDATRIRHATQSAMACTPTTFQNMASRNVDVGASACRSSKRGWRSRRHRNAPLPAARPRPPSSRSSHPIGGQRPLSPSTAAAEVGAWVGGGPAHAVFKLYARRSTSFLISNMKHMNNIRASPSLLRCVCVLKQGRSGSSKLRLWFCPVAAFKSCKGLQQFIPNAELSKIKGRVPMPEQRHNAPNGCCCLDGSSSTDRTV